MTVRVVGIYCSATGMGARACRGPRRRYRGDRSGVAPPPSGRAGADDAIGWYPRWRRNVDTVAGSGPAPGLGWVVNAYLLTFAGFLLLGGRAVDLLGPCRVLAVSGAGGVSRPFRLPGVRR
jgi:hypothetical protein